MSKENAAQLATEWWVEKLMSGDRAKFREALYPFVLGDLANHDHCFLDCDYDPRDHLLTAVRAAGLKCSGGRYSCLGILPQKHSLDVYPDRLEPKEGYGVWPPAIPVPP